jgi:hypothetical protein
VAERTNMGVYGGDVDVESSNWLKEFLTKCAKVDLKKKAKERNDLKKKARTTLSVEYISRSFKFSN